MFVRLTLVIQLCVVFVDGAESNPPQKQAPTTRGPRSPRRGQGRPSSPRKPAANGPAGPRPSSKGNPDDPGKQGGDPVKKDSFKSVPNGLALDNNNSSKMPTLEGRKSAPARERVTSAEDKKKPQATSSEKRVGATERVRNADNRRNSPNARSGSGRERRPNSTREPSANDRKKAGPDRGEKSAPPAGGKKAVPENGLKVAPAQSKKTGLDNGEKAVPDNDKNTKEVSKTPQVTEPDGAKPQRTPRVKRQDQGTPLSNGHVETAVEQ